MVQQEEGVRICDCGGQGIFLPPHGHNSRGVQIFEARRVRKRGGSIYGRWKEQASKDNSPLQLGPANVRGGEELSK